MTCPRSWEVEASLDGRLDEPGAQGARAHRLDCVACNEEHGRLVELRSALQRMDADRPDPFTLKRLRNETLARASGRAAPARPLARGRIASLVVAAAALCAFGVYEARQGRDASSASSGEDVSITAGDGGSFHREVDGDVERVVVTDGEFAFDVRAHASGRRLVVALPDGEVEDVGTRFSITVKGERTQAIAVTDGRVVFRRAGHDPVELSAGMHWTVADEASANAATAPKPAAEAASPGTSAVAAAIPAPTASSVDPPPLAGASAGASSSGMTSSAEVASTSLSSSARRTTHASARATGVPAPEPSGSAAPSQDEDTAYMTVIALMREGRREEARIRARDYVRQFPRGLRRSEMSRVAQ